MRIARFAKGDGVAYGVVEGESLGRPGAGTISGAGLTIAETGHLAFATLHTNSAITTINRIIDVFPPHQQSQIRAQLSFTLVAVMTQMLSKVAVMRGVRHHWSLRNVRSVI